MAEQASGSSSLGQGIEEEEEDGEFVYGYESGWVEARTSCDHLASLSSDLVHIPIPSTPCNRLALPFLSPFVKARNPSS
uniref:Histone deacetylase 6-like n=1 Tax=Rhizophora mucronata TaxID=61149 RepID=A0A2P2JM45_RHIMU